MTGPEKKKGAASAPKSKVKMVTKKRKKAKVTKSTVKGDGNLQGEINVKGPKRTLKATISITKNDEVLVGSRELPHSSQV